MALFTIELELGAETRGMIERVMQEALLRIELGMTPETRETIVEVFPTPSKGKAREVIEGLVGKEASEDR